MSKAEAAELRKRQKEMQKWEKGKYALKSIVAEIDRKVVELGSVGGKDSLDLFSIISSSSAISFYLCFLFLALASPLSKQDAPPSNYFHRLTFLL